VIETTNSAVLPEGLVLPGPNVIGATGGSGTRVVARMVRTAGLYTGQKLNPYEDAVELGFYSDRWIDRYVAAGGDVAPEQRAEMEADLRSTLADHLSTVSVGASAWGWKEPRSIYLLRFWNETMPGLRFVHFLRDGRDMAFSDNQQQLKKHGGVVLGDDLRRAKTPTRSIALWNRVNLAAADYGERELGPRYLRVRFEDLCADPQATVSGIFDFFRLDGDAGAAATEVRSPETLGRWQKRREKVIAELTARRSSASATSNQEGSAKRSLCRRAALLAPKTASSVAPVASGYERSLRPCFGTTIAPRRRATFRQTRLAALAVGCPPWRPGASSSSFRTAGRCSTAASEASGSPGGAAVGS
jgi:hypothetical protein